MKKVTKKTSEFDYKTIKSFEDACKKQNIDPTKLPDVSMIPEGMGKAILAVYRLFIIFQAINNGWKPDWNNNKQWKYFPWLEVEANASLSSGFGFSDAYYNCVRTRATVGSHLCTDMSEKALYIGKQFQAEYKEFFLFSE